MFIVHCCVLGRMLYLVYLDKSSYLNTKISSFTEIRSTRQPQVKDQTKQVQKVSLMILSKLTRQSHSLSSSTQSKPNPSHICCCTHYHSIYKYMLRLIPLPFNMPSSCSRASPCCLLTTPSLASDTKEKCSMMLCQCRVSLANPVSNGISTTCMDNMSWSSPK